jgi:uncharacterized Tic20 family protein
MARIHGKQGERMIEPTSQPDQGSGVPIEGSSDSRGWAVGAHLSPWIGGFLGPLIIWLAKKDDPYVEYHARAALNFQISLLIYVMGWLLVATVAIALLAVAGAIVVGIVIFGLGFLAFVYLGFVPPIIGAIKASNGELYRYPVSIAFIKEPGR